ncbi:CLCN3 [Cordylochernes scorpioides]|uniref:CLCN3 n=1 Tax=Cordylochernes scorpioides TaxID=51811 RepID=A0ABY6LIE0_9ARAC|nr:CLCN3 [Cordylochernes scorpioides]
MVEENPNWKEKVITGDETWVYGYDPETKRQSMEWKGKDEPRMKKSRLCKSKNKVLLVTFFDIKGIVHYEYLEEGQTINKESYLNIMRLYWDCLMNPINPNQYEPEVLRIEWSPRYVNGPGGLMIGIGDPGDYIRSPDLDGDAQPVTEVYSGLVYSKHVKLAARGPHAAHNE